MSDFPALTGDVVTERHARICREIGHATHTVEGVPSGICPRCGESVHVTPGRSIARRGR